MGPGALPPLGPRVPAISVGSYPYSVVFDPQNQLLYAINEGSNNVSVIGGNRVVATIPVGVGPFPGVYDAADGFVYVPNYSSSNVTVINGTTVRASIPVSNSPYFPAYDPANGYVYIPEFSSSVVVVINGTKAVASVNVGSAPEAAAFDPANEYMYIPNFSSDTVSVVNGTTVVATVSVGLNPEAPAVDPVNGWVYVPNDGGSSVSVLNGTTLIATVTVGANPIGGAYDAADGFVYIASGLTNTVSVINGTQVLRTVPVGGNPQTPVYDPGDGHLYVPNFSTANVSVIADTRVLRTVSVGMDPYPPTYDPSNGEMVVPNSNSNNVSLISTWNPVSVTETGLPAGTSWWVNTSRGDSVTTNTSQLSFPSPNGQFNYSVGSANRTWAAPSGSLSVADGPTNISLVFGPVTYRATFRESGLPTGTDWAVTIGGVVARSPGPTVIFALTNGSYNYTLGGVAGWSAGRPAGSLYVRGAPVSELVLWSAVIYPVKFIEVGLPNGTGWWANVTSTPSQYSASDTIDLTEANGTFAYWVAAANRTYSAPGGTITVIGTGVLVDLNFTLRTYPISFNEVGLPIGTEWSVLVEGVRLSTSTAALETVGVNGTDDFTVASVAGFLPSPATGTIAVVGASVNQTVLFLVVAPSTFTVTFTESGLRAGLTWSVTFAGATKGSTGPILFSGIRNGTYRFSVATVGSFAPIVQAGTLTLDGSSITKGVTFQGSSSPPATWYGLTGPGRSGLLFGGVAALIAAAAVGGVALWRRRGRPRSTNRKPFSNRGPTGRER